jgi:hypothetical protein
VLLEWVCDDVPVAESVERRVEQRRFVARIEAARARCRAFRAGSSLERVDVRDPQQ